MENITSFQLKLAENLANISSAPGDEFKLISYEHDYNEFDCDLCGHKHCVRKYIIQNLETKVTMNVGSECINHFKGKGIDIDLAEGLMKRVERATSYSRKTAVLDLGHEIWDDLPLEEKLNLYNNYKEDSVSKYVPTDVITKLGKATFKALPKNEKDERTVKAYIIDQAKRLLVEATWYKTHALLTEEQIKDVVALGLNKELERYETAVARRK